MNKTFQTCLVTQAHYFKTSYLYLQTKQSGYLKNVINTKYNSGSEGHI